jgi:hypothetical protein
VKRGIVVGAYWRNRDFLIQLLNSLVGCGYPVMVVVSGSKDSPIEYLEEVMHICRVMDWGYAVNREDRYELGAFEVALRNTDWDEFLFLQDTFEVLDQSFIGVVMETPGSVALGPTFFHYAGKWLRSVLETMDIPVVTSKQQSAHWEHTFSRLYWERVGPAGVMVADPAFHDGNPARFEDRFGRHNMILENQWYRKYKADWGQRPLIG